MSSHDKRTPKQYFILLSTRVKGNTAVMENIISYSLLSGSHCTQNHLVNLGQEEKQSLDKS